MDYFYCLSTQLSWAGSVWWHCFCECGVFFVSFCFLNAGRFLHLKHQLLSLIVSAPLDQLAALLCFLWVYILTCDTCGWNTAASLMLFLYIPSKQTKDNVFFSITSQFFAFHQLMMIPCWKSCGTSAAKPFPSSMVRWNVDGIKSQYCLWRWKQFMQSCAASAWSLLCIFPLFYSIPWFYFLECQARCNLKCV